VKRISRYISGSGERIGEAIWPLMTTFIDTAASKPRSDTDTESGEEED
jgi:hypothetical protein